MSFIIAKGSQVPNIPYTQYKMKAYISLRILLTAATAFAIKKNLIIDTDLFSDVE